MRNLREHAWLARLGVFGLTGFLLATALLGPRPAWQQDALPLAQQSDITYVGAFRVPTKDALGNNPLSYGGHALGFNSVNKSLFYGCHDWYQKLAEVSIPTPETDPGKWQTARVLQNCTDVTEGTLGSVDDSNSKLAANLVYNNRLITSAFSYYDADGSQRVTHGASANLDLATGNNFSGFFELTAAASPRARAGYFALIPEAWRALFGGPAFAGGCCQSIISTTSSGPSVTVFDPDAVGSGPIPGTTLLYYPLSNPLPSPYFDVNSTTVAGAAFPPNSRSVLFFGRTGVGTSCYGTGAECGDPCAGSKGGHNYPYEHKVWAYDASDLLAVKAGTKQTWDVQPYAFWTLSEMGSSGCASANFGGAAYDPTAGLLYYSAGGGESPVVHVYRLAVSGGAATTSPTPTATPPLAPLSPPPPPPPPPSAPGLPALTYRLPLPGSVFSLGSLAEFLWDLGTAAGVTTSCVDFYVDGARVSGGSGSLVQVPATFPFPRCP